MTFLAPFFWVFSALAAPVVLFYLVRERPRRQVVSQIFFWPEDHSSLSESSRWRKLRRWFSLLLQLLFLFLLVAALTRPIWPWATVAAKPLILILDGSASMRTADVKPNRFEAAREAAETMALGSHIPVAVILTGSPPRVLSGWTDSRREIAAAFSEVQPGDMVVSPREAIDLAKALAKSRDAGIWFFTDGVWDGALSEPTLDGIRIVKFGGEAANAGISRFSARRSPSAPGEVSIFVEALRSPATGGPQAMLTLERNGRVTDSREMRLMDSEPWRKSWTFQEEEAANYRATIDGYNGDQLAFDNSFQISVPPLPAVEAVLVSKPDRFLEAALSAVPAFNYVRLWPPDSLRFGDASKLWIFCGVLPPPDFQAAGLVLIAPETGGFFGEKLGVMKDPLITEVLQDSELMRHVSLQNVFLKDVTEFQPAEGATNFVASAGRPLVFGKWSGSPRWVVFSMDPSTSDLVTRAAFPVLISNIVQSLRGDLGNPVSAAGASPELSRLISHVPDSQVSLPQTAGFTIPSRPFWRWILVASVVWLFLEWVTYHRRVTE